MAIIRDDLERDRIVLEQVKLGADDIGLIRAIIAASKTGVDVPFGRADYILDAVLAALVARSLRRAALSCRRPRSATSRDAKAGSMCLKFPRSDQ